MLKPASVNTAELIKHFCYAQIKQLLRVAESNVRKDNKRKKHMLKMNN